MIVVVNKYLVGKGYTAMAVYPFIFFRKREYINPVRLNHEKIHLKQQLELLIIPFYIWYFIDFAIKYFRYRNWQTAYRNIVFEKEAYTNQRNLKYLKGRKLYGFYKKGGNY